MEYAIGIDLGGTNIKLLAVSPQGEILKQEQSPTHDRQARDTQWAEKIAQMVENIEGELGKTEWIGVSAPGMADRQRRRIVSLPGRLSGLEGLDWTQFLNRKNQVVVLNDAHAALFGELWKGSAARYQNVIFLTLGTGVGGAFTYNRELQGGTLGRAGHFGHTCLNPDGELDIKNSPGSIELMFAECTVKERTEGKFDSTKALVKAYLAGDPFAAKVWLRSVYCLACAIATFINIIDPEIVLLGGGISEAGDALLKPLREYMDKVEWRIKGRRVPITFAVLGNHAGALGVARYAILHSVPELVP